MTGYSWISVISLVSYLFLFFTFMGAKKAKQEIRSFMQLLVVMICWTGGSFGMRMQFMPGPYFWHHVSLLGVMLLPIAYMNFSLDFVGVKKQSNRKRWFALFVLIYVFNCFTNFFVPLPEIVEHNGTTQFLYQYDWHIYIIFVLIMLCFIHTVIIMQRYLRGNRVAIQRLVPVIIGLLVLVIGHVMATFPAFVGLPLDIISGVINALFLFYALYQRKLFRMTMLLSKSTYCMLALAFGIAIAPGIAVRARRFLIETGDLAATHADVVVVLFLVLIIAALYMVINAFFDSLFVSAEQQQSKLVARFGEEVTHMLCLNEILQRFAETIKEAIPVERLYICVRNLDGEYRIAHTPNPLDETNFYIRSDHPIITYFRTNDSSGITLQDFSRATIYRSMWESEKKMLQQLDIDCFVPLISDHDLTGLVLLSKKKDGSSYNEEDFQFFRSLSMICGMAVKNACSYEMALEKARRDELTGLINRNYFLELLEDAMQDHISSSVSLCIFNIDDFKLYNQLYGTQEGNIALQKVAGILEASLNSRGKAARIGGKVFAVLLQDYDIYSAKCLAENLAAQIAKINDGVNSGRLTVSVGICAAPYMASTAKELLKNAETAVYAVKRAGKNAVLMYSAEINNQEKTREPHKSGYSEHAGTIYALTAAIDAKDHYTFQHSKNVAYYASSLARGYGMDDELVEIVKEAGLLHDIGKIGVREDVLNKPGKLTAEEYELMKTHPDNAVNIIKYLPSLDYVIPAVLSHHERYDGKGYPRRLAGEDIPILGRILSVADAFDAMTSARSYKPAMKMEQALKILKEEAGAQFDPNLVQIFCELIDKGTIVLQSQISHPSEFSEDALQELEKAPELSD